MSCYILKKERIREGSWISEDECLYDYTKKKSANSYGVFAASHDGCNDRVDRVPGIPAPHSGYVESLL